MAPSAPKTKINHSLKTNRALSKTGLLVFGLVFALIGGYVLYRSFAAPNPSLPGDLNNDNVVNVSDLSILLSDFNTTNPAADINKDGIVNILDMSILLSHYGQSLSAMTVPATSVGHAIDGNLNESDWNLNHSASLCVLGTSCNNTVTWGTLWDSNYLYVGVKVLDGNLQNDSANCWDDDSVEVYVDPTNAGGTTYTSQDRQFVQRYNSSGLCSGVGSSTGVLSAWAATSGGYEVEMAIPWTNLGVTPSSGMTIGFDVGNNDDDDGGARDSQLMTYGTASNSSNPSAFGHLTLTGTPTGGGVTGGGGGGGGSTSCSGTGNGAVGTTRGGLMGFANGYRDTQLSTSQRTTYMTDIANTGAKWYRLDMLSWNMSEFQDVVKNANNLGLCVIGDINEDPNGAGWDDPANHATWAAAAANEVSQLKGSIHVWEIWNEENNETFWPSADYNSYADLLHQTYVAIHNVDPTATVLVGGFSPCGDGTAACNSVNVLEDLYNWNKSQGRSGSNQLFDAVAMHPYGYPWNPLDPANATQSWNAFYQTYLLHQVMANASYGGPTNDGSKRIWGTEGGWPTNCPSGNSDSANCLSTTAAAAEIGPLMDQWMGTWGSFTGPFMWYETQDQNGQESNAEGYFGFIDENWNPKQPIYSTLQSYSAETAP